MPKIFLFLLFSWGLQAQVSSPDYFPNGDQSLTLIFDLKLAKDPRANGLLGKTSDVYLWSGAASKNDGNGFEFQPIGQLNFNAIFEPGKMIPLGNDQWSIKLIPRTYYNVPVNTKIVKLGLLLKSGDGKFQTEDLFFNLYLGSYNLKWLSPKTKFTLSESGKSIGLRAKFSATSSYTLTSNQLTISTESNTDSLNFNYPLGPEKGKLYSLILASKSGSFSIQDTLIIFTKPEPQIQEIPFGIHDGINDINGHIILCFYAPLSSFVYVIGEFSNWEIQSKYVMKKAPDGIRNWIDLGIFPAGKEIGYQFMVDGQLVVADPLTEKILDSKNDPNINSNTYPNLKSYPKNASGIVSVFQPSAPEYDWKSKSFNRPTPENLHIYELLIRDFSSDRKYKSVADSIPYLKNLGINAIELMPVQEFTGNDSWGYNPTFYLAADKAYGTKDELKYLIDQCHQNGIAVILDLVLNQADSENPYVKMYWDGTKPSAINPFFNSTAPHPYSVFFDFNHESLHTQWLVDIICKFWIQEYKIDGYRFDLSKGFTQKNSNANVNIWSQYDPSRVKILKRIYDQIRSYDSSAYMILEHFATANEENELGDYGMLLWGNSKFDMTKITNGFSQDLTSWSYKNNGFSKPSVIQYMESHDEERLMVEMSNNSKKIFTDQEKLERMKMAAGLLFTIPGPKMMWQFGELGYDVSINTNGRTGVKPLKWNYTKETERAKLLQVYQHLGKLKTSKSIFSTRNFSLESSGQTKRNLLSNDTESLVFIANPRLENDLVSGNFPTTGKWYDYFSGKAFTVLNRNAQIVLNPGEFHLMTTQEWNKQDLGIVPWKEPNFMILGTEIPANSTVFPNPFIDQIEIKFPTQSTTQTHVQLFNTAGQIIWEKNYPNQLFNIHLTEFSYLPAGKYLLAVSENNSITRFNLIKK